MSENERRQRMISSTPRLTPDEVVSRSFPTAFRGISETDVRAFLKRVAEELTMVRSREQELMASVDELEAKLRNPRPLDEQELLEALGEETTRLLRSAREAATDIRGKAEERASRLVHDAQEDAKRVRQEADDVLGVRTTEAETVAQGLLEEAERRASDLMRVADERAAEVRASAERFAEELRSRVEREALSEIESSRERGLALIEEATSLRERIIDDLSRRRELLTGQLEELRTGRDHLLDSYRVVKRTFLEATEALAQVEAKATTSRAAAGPDPADLADALAGEAQAAQSAGLDAPQAPDVAAEAPASETVTEEADAADETAAAEQPAAEEEPAAEAAGAPGAEAAPADASAEPDASADDQDSEAPAANLADVDDLFARLRAGTQAAPEVADDGEATASVATSDNGAAAPSEAAAETPASSDASVSCEPEVNLVEEEAPLWLSARDAALAPVRVTLVRQIKLAIGNEQNEVLDKVRRHKGRPVATNVLPDPEAQTAAWSAVISTTASEAYRLGRTADGGEAGAVPDELVPDLAHAMIEPLRERVVAAIDGPHEPGETANQIAERIGARYREWKNRAAESSSGDVLVAAYVRGRYDAAADGATFTWSTPPSGCCPDCADNVLEPTRKGETFPTGQAYPPAHPGCRCGLTSSEAASGEAATDAESNAVESTSTA